MIINNFICRNTTAPQKNFPAEHTPLPLGWLTPSGKSSLALIYTACYALLDACENVCVEVPEGVKWELRFACFCTGKMGFRSLGQGFESEKKPKWDWDWCFCYHISGIGTLVSGIWKKMVAVKWDWQPPFRTLLIRYWEDTDQETAPWRPH